MMMRFTTKIVYNLWHKIVLNYSMIEFKSFNQDFGWLFYVLKDGKKGLGVLL